MLVHTAIGMPNWGYAFNAYDEERMVRASGRDLRISPKAAREICASIRHMRLERCRIFLSSVIEKKQAVPYRRHNKEVPHRRGLQGWYAGRYPVKAAKEILKILDSLEANAQAKGLDLERLRLVHAAAHRARILKRYIPRAFGRSSPNFENLCHVELVAEEVG
ncbi:MAG: 50S ribosomal protein L22 [Nitrososphaerota archaeon]